MSASCQRSGPSWFARYLEWRERRWPDLVLRRHRGRVLAGLSGRVLELGCGDGVNFEHYPPTVTRVVAIEPQAAARAHAETRAADAPVTVEVVAAHGESLPLEDGSVDAVVCFAALCSVSDQARVLAELRRVLRAGGELRFYEHVRSRSPLLAALQDAVDAAGWPRLLWGCHTSRDTEGALRAAGFEIVWLRRFLRCSSLLTIPASPQIVGIARLR
jgi:SAM-dependent methyltransferase